MVRRVFQRLRASPILPVYDGCIERSQMITNVRARFSRGVLRPIEPLDLEEGEEVKLSIEDAPQSPGGLASIAAIVKELHKGIPPDAWDDLPRDLAKNKKHYLYGHSREAD